MAKRLSVRYPAHTPKKPYGEKELPPSKRTLQPDTDSLRVRDEPVRSTTSARAAEAKSAAAAPSRTVFLTGAHGSVFSRPGPVAQRSEHPAHNRSHAGSNPAGPNCE